MPKENMEQNGFVNIRFIIFLKATLGKMVATEILGNDFVDLNFWQQWPKKFNNIKTSSKNDFVKHDKVLQPMHECLEPDSIAPGAKEVEDDEIAPTQMPESEEQEVGSQSILVFI